MGRGRRGLAGAGLLLLLLLGLASPGPASSSSPAPAPASGPDDDRSGMVDGARQVTVFGIIASPQLRSVDPKLDQIATQLRKLKPDHGFRLRAVATERLSPGDRLKCDLGDGLEARVTLLESATAEGKLRLGFTLRRRGKVEFRTTVTTPPNQLFFCEKELGGNDRLLIGVGAR